MSYGKAIGPRASTPPAAPSAPRRPGRSGPPTRRRGPWSRPSRSCSVGQLGKPSAVRIARAHELQERAGHPAGQPPRPRAAAGVASASGPCCRTRSRCRGSGTRAPGRRTAAAASRTRRRRRAPAASTWRRRARPRSAGCAHQGPDLHRLPAREGLGVGLDDVLALSPKPGPKPARAFTFSTTSPS